MGRVTLVVKVLTVGVVERTVLGVSICPVHMSSDCVGVVERTVLRVSICPVHIYSHC
jgi:hypothetical protein